MLLSLAMVTYQDLAVAQAAVEALQGLVLNERKIQATLEECKASIKVEAPRQVSGMYTRFSAYCRYIFHKQFS